VKKNRKYTAALTCFLAFNLLFNQIALNFFHNKHDDHKSYQIQSNQAQFHSHGQHCKVCSLDTLFHLYFEASPEFHFYQTEKIAVAIPVLAKVIASDFFVKGRAPPFLI
jgi:hypothetical protein